MASFGVLVAPCVMRGVWGDAHPILGVQLALCVMRGGLGGILPPPF